MDINGIMATLVIVNVAIVLEIYQLKGGYKK
jgi:hypothetical protein